MTYSTSTVTQAEFSVVLTAMVAALRGRDAGMGVHELWPAWHDATGMSRARFNLLLRGTCKSSTAQEAYKIIAGEAARLDLAAGLSCPTPRVGRIARLTCELLLQMRAAAVNGASLKELASQYQISLQIVRQIIQGGYPTKAMREALTVERKQAGQNIDPS